MRALTLHGDRDLRYEQVADPRLEAPEDVLVRVELCAVCGSDLHPYLGREAGYDAGTVPGHEFVGEVIEAGKAVEHLRPGTRVYSPFTTSCGRCRFCRLGLTSRCERGELFGWRQRGRGLHGGQAELVRVPLSDTTLLAIPDGIDDIEALLLGDVLSTGYYCAEQSGLQPGDSVAVVGCGPVGLMAIVGARELGVEEPVALDPVPDRRRHAQRLGARAESPERAPELVDRTDGGFDVVLEAVGSQESTRLAFDLLRPGGTLSSVGVHTRTDFSFTPVEAYDRNLTLRVGRCPARRLMEQLVPLVRSQRYDLTGIVSHRLPLAEGPAAYELFASRREGVVKAVLEP